MHPVLADRANLAAYLLGWLFVGAVCAGLGMAAGWGLPLSVLFGGLSALFASLLFFPVYYPCLALRSGKTGMALRLGALAVVAAAFGAVWAGAMHLALALPWREHFDPPGYMALAAMGWFICVLAEAVFYVQIAQERAAEAERLGQEMRVLAREAELRALRAQINPHFLFNGLNSISALTAADPKRAREMCVLLSDFLRKSLRLGERLSVPLSEELDLARNYFAIEQIRFGQRLCVAWDIDGAALDAEVPTLLLQPLVENAVKHGISQLIEGGTVSVGAKVRDGLVLITLENPFDSGLDAPKGLGMGARQVYQRVTTRFGAEGRMEVDSKDGRHSVRLIFPMTRKEPGDE